MPGGLARLMSPSRCRCAPVRVRGRAPGDVAEEFLLLRRTDPRREVRYSVVQTRQGVLASPLNLNNQEKTMQQLFTDPTLLTVAINSALDVCWPVLPQPILDQLAWV